MRAHPGVSRGGSNAGRSCGCSRGTFLSDVAGAAGYALMRTGGRPTRWTRRPPDSAARRAASPHILPAAQLPLLEGCADPSYHLPVTPVFIAGLCFQPAPRIDPGGGAVRRDPPGVARGCRPRLGPVCGGALPRYHRRAPKGGTSGSAHSPGAHEARRRAAMGPPAS